MQKSCMFSILFYVILINVLHLQARDEHQPHFSISYAFQQDTSNNSIQFPTIEQSHRPFSGTQYSYGSFEYKQALLRRSGSTTIANHTYPITREDFDLIQKIYLDNPNHNKDVLWKTLLQSPLINEAAILMKNNYLLHCFNLDIYINPEHFKHLSNAPQRLKLLTESAIRAMDHRHKSKKDNLTAQHTIELKAAKKKAKTEENKVTSTHKRELAELEIQHKQERKHPFGIKQSKKPIAGSLQSQPQIIQPVQPQQTTKKSNISSGEVQKLREYNNNQVTKINSKAISTAPCNQDNSFQQVMDKRSKAFEASVKNQAPTTEYIKINSQTTAFLQVQNIDVTQFTQIEGLSIQHQLTHELIDVLDAVADYTQQHHYEIYQEHLTKYCAHLASLSQQSNMQGALEQAIDGTNCCHGITHYLEGMVSGVAQAYQQFQTALDYFDCVLDRYEHEITQTLQHAAQGAMVAHGLETIVTAGMIVAPTATVAATGIMIGTTVYVIAPLCAQAMIDIVSFGGACIVGDWDKVASDLDNFNTFISSQETVARMAELAGGAAIPTPNLNYVVNQVLSLRPVITSVQKASGEMVQSLYLMTKNQLQKVYMQGVELLQLPEFINFNMSYKKICGFNFFDILPQSHPALAGALSGLESGAMSSAEQAALTQLFIQAEESVVADIVRSGTSSVGSQAMQTVEQGAKSLIAEQIDSITQLHEVLQHEITQASREPVVSIDLTAKITEAKSVELRELSLQIRQLQDLAKYTDNFKNLEYLITEDICYLNRVHELQSYRAQIKNFLDTNKPYFMYEGQAYFIEDIASYHIHAGDYYRKDNPSGGHSNYQGHKLNHFKPQLIKNGPLGTTDVILQNPRLQNRTKPSSIYPKKWPEYMCDLKAIEVVIGSNAEIKPADIPGVLRIKGFTSEDLEVIIYYDIKNKRIRTHYPNII